MGLQAEHTEQPLTWVEYQDLPDDQRWEIIDGTAYAMTPGPLFRHQKISAKLLGALDAFFAGKGCHSLAAPMDVKLSESDIVQPDILVVCDLDRIKPTHIEGAPTLVVEILSRSSIVHDRVRKLHLYAAHGVKEYWLVAPYPSVVEVLVLENGVYSIADTYARDDVLVSPTFPGLSIPLADVFSFPIPPEERVDEIKESAPPYSAARSM